MRSQNRKSCYRILLKAYIIFAIASTICLSKVSSSYSANAYASNKTEDTSIFDFLFGGSKSLAPATQLPVVKRPLEHDTLNQTVMDNNSEGSFHETGQIRLLNTNTGNSEIHTLKLNDTKKLEDLAITILACWREKNVKIRPESIALVEIYKGCGDNHLSNTDLLKPDEATNQETIFYGWLFSNHKSIAQPVYRHYHIQLVQCQ